MPGRDKPFVMYVGGALSVTIVPRGVKGWTQFVLWLALLVPLVIWLAEHLATGTNGDLGSGLFLFCLGVVVWLIGGLWWMLARAEVVQVVELRREEQYARRKQAREQARARQSESDPGRKD